MSDLTGYVAEGKSGRTFGVSNGENVYIQIENPKGELGMITPFADIDNWTLKRWKGQLGADEVDLDEIPEELKEHARQGDTDGS